MVLWVRGKWTKTIHKYRNNQYCQDRQKTDHTRAGHWWLGIADDTLLWEISQIDKTYKYKCLRAQQDAKRNEFILLSTMNNWFLLCLEVSNYAVFSLFHHQVARLCDQKLKSTSTVWIQCFRVLNQNSTMEMSMSGHERVTDFRYVLLLEKLLQAECLHPPQIHMWKPPQSEGIRRWDLWEVIRVRWNHESGASVMRLVDPKASFLCASKEGSCEHTRWWPPTSQEQRKWNWPCLCLDLGHASLQTVRSTFLLFEPLCLWYFGSLCRLRQ